MIHESLRTDSSRPRFLTPNDAAVHLGGLNARTVARWAREGYIPAFPLGEGKRRLWRFLLSDLDAWMAARRTGQDVAGIAGVVLG